MITRKRIALASAALALGGGLIAAPGALASQGAPTAQAAAEAQGVQKASCTYPNVCFIKGGKTVASYKDMGYQKLGTKARSATAGHNSRNDDGAKLYFVHTSGKKATSCAKPHQSWTVKKGWKMYALDIRNSPTCK